jgi:tetratricopeptide (TPR) repeat protein
MAAACLAFLAAVPANAENPSKPFEKPLKAVQEAFQAKHFDDAAAKLRDARALPNPTPYDTFVMNEFAGPIYANQQKMAEAYDAFNANINSPFLAEKDRPSRLKVLAQLAYQQKNYPAAIEHVTKLESLGSDDDTARVIKAQSYYLTNKYKEAGAALSDIIARDEKAGHHPDKQNLLLLRQVQEKLGDSAGQGRTIEKLLNFYPSPDLWTLAVASLKDRADKAKDDRLTLQVYRLLADVGSLKSAPQYSEMAQLAVEQGFPGEAVKVLDQGMAKGVFSGLEKDRNGRLLESAKKLVVAERDNLAKVEAMANKSADGNLLVVAGSSHAFNLDNPSKGAPLVAAGIAKGSLKSANDAYITLGVINFRMKSNAEAEKAFDKVDKNDAYERLAKLWSLHVR